MVQIRDDILYCLLLDDICSCQPRLVDNSHAHAPFHVDPTGRKEGRRKVYNSFLLPSSTLGVAIGLLAS